MADAEVVIQIKGDSKEYEAVIKGLGQTTQNALSTSIKGSMIGNILANAFSKASSVISSSLDGAISRVDTLNQFPKVMQNIGFSADEAQSSISRMSDGIEGLPTSLDEIVGNTQQLAMSLGDLDQATDVALALNDGFITFGASSADVTSAITQLNQMVNTGKYDMQSWNSINQSAPGYLDAVAKSMLGSSANASQLRDALNNGEISTQDFLNAIVKMDKEGGAGFEAFSKSAKDASGGIATSMSNVLTAVKKNLANIIQELNSNGEISGAFDTLKSKVNEFGSKVVEAVGWIKENFDTVKPVLIGAFSIFTGGTLISGIGRVSSVVTEFMAKFQAPTLAKAIQGAFSASNFSGGLTAIQSIGVKIGELVTKVGGLSGVFSSIGTAISGVVAKLGTGLVGAFSKITTVIAGIGAPTLIAVAAIAALVAGMTYFFTQTEQGQAALQQIISILQVGFAEAMTVIMPLIQQLGQTFMQMGAQLAPVFAELATTFASLFTQLAPVFTQLATMVAEVVAQIAPLIADLVAQVVPALMQIASVIASAIIAVLPVIIPIITQIVSIILQIANVALPLITTAIQILVPIITNIISVVVTVVTTIISTVANLVSNIVNFFTVTVPGAIDTMVSFFSNLPGNIANFLGNVISAVVSWVSEMVSNATQAGSEFVSNVVNFFTSLPGSIAGFLSNVISTVAGWVGQMASNAINAAAEFGGNLLNGLASIPGQVASIGGDIIQGIVNGITGAAGNVVSAITGAIGDAIGAAKSLLGIASPSKLMRDLIGKNMVRGVAVGIEKNASTAVKATKDLSERLVTTAQGYAPDLANALNATDGLTISAEGDAGILGESFMANIEAITSRLDSILDKLESIENQMKEDTSIKIDKREFARLCRESI